jgi:hypothetical protein
MKKILLFVFSFLFLSGLGIYAYSGDNDIYLTRVKFVLKDNGGVSVWNEEMDIESPDGTGRAVKKNGAFNATLTVSKAGISKSKLPQVKWNLKIVQSDMPVTLFRFSDIAEETVMSFKMTNNESYDLKIYVFFAKKSYWKKYNIKLGE